MASGSTAIAAAAPRTPRPRRSDRVVLFRAGRRRLGRPPVRVRRPVRPHIRTDQPARCANHPTTQRPHRGLVREPVCIHGCAVVAPARATVDEKITATVSANVTERDGLETLATARRHCANNPDALTALGSLGSGSVKLASSSLARPSSRTRGACKPGETRLHPSAEANRRRNR
jgi:hypothetical protein